MAGAGGGVEVSVVDEGGGGANIPSAVAMAGEHWNDGFDEVAAVALAVAAAVGDVVAYDMLRIRGLSIIGVPGSDMGDDSLVSSSPWIYPHPYPRGPGVGT